MNCSTSFSGISVSGNNDVDFAPKRRHCEFVKNITVTLDDETYRRARIKAAEMETSVSALVKKFLSDLAAEESEFERLKKMEQALRDRIVTFRASDRLSRDEVHERGR
jgi:hypothetical protein